MDKTLIIIKSAVDTYDFEHGIELLIAATDLDFAFDALIMEDACGALTRECTNERYKKLKQLNLFNINTYAQIDKENLKDEFSFVQCLTCSDAGEKLKTYHKVLTF